MMSEEIIFCCYLLHPKQVCTYHRIIFRIKQINLFRVKSCLFVREHEVFVAFHCEQEQPTLIFIIVTVHDGQMLDCPCSSLKVRHDVFLQVAVGIAEDGHMMIAACAYIVGRHASSFAVAHGLTLHVVLVVQGNSVAHATNGDTLYLYATLAVQPNGVLVKV